ncbi:MAG: diphosphomevalonate decarboxylase [Bacteroidota bacterium]
MELAEIKKEILSWKSTSKSELTSTWRSPSNIALLKYWGKRESQLPVNPSLSFSLSKAHTTTKLTASPDTNNSGIKKINNNTEHPFLNKIKPFWQTVIKEIPLLKDYSIDIETHNTFPHSAGIASSASGFSALALALIDLAQSISSNKLHQGDFIKYASSLSRMGSGSACRSVNGGFNLWGATDLWNNSSDYYAIDINENIHPSFRNLHDAILLVSAKEKSMSSTKGHALMKEHPYANGRLLQANNNLSLFKKALSEGDLELLSKLSENEALSLHALIMSSEGGDILLEPASLELIQRIRNARQKGLSIFFTIDAGPNIHLIYPDSGKKNVEEFIKNELSEICSVDKVIFDYCGKGPEKINELNKSIL